MALTDFLQGWEVWPTYEQFIQGGGKGLREALARIGGVQYWAKEMGLPGGDRPLGGVRHWTNDAIRAALANFFGDRPDWPSQREFDEAGLHALREALRHYGGPERWAREMSVVLAPEMARSTARPRPPVAKPADKSPRKWPLWHEQRIAAELEVFLRGRYEWPRHREFVETGRKGLYQAVLSHGGTHEWARRMGVKWVKRYGGLARYWTEERVRDGLAGFLDGRGHWPTASEFVQEGESRLLRGVRSTGGVERWAAEFGLRKATPSGHADARQTGRQARSPGAKNSGPTRRLWDDERIETAIAPLVGELGRWPTKSEFQRPGLRVALSAVYDHGGSALWQKRLGVSRKPFKGPLPDSRRWTDERVETELREFCRGRTTWPGQREFQARGAAALYHAACTHGGAQLWRERLGLQ